MDSVSPDELAYLAGLIDVRAKVGVVRVNGVLLPRVALSSPDPRVAALLGAVTEMKPVTVNRNYDRVGCDIHCEQKHVHVFSTTSRWSVTGSKATVLLAALRPWLRLQQDEADMALAVGRKARFKPKTVESMKRLGWPVDAVSGEDS